MGNSIAVDMGPLYLEVVVFLSGPPDEALDCTVEYAPSLGALMRRRPALFVGRRMGPATVVPVGGTTAAA